MTSVGPFPDSTSLLQSGVTFEDPTTAVVNLVVFAGLSMLTAGGLTIAYRWYFKSLIPEGISILTGVATVALYINTASLGAIVSEGSVDLFRPNVVFFNVVVLGVSILAAPVGRRIGDAVASELFSLIGLGQIDTEMSTMVRSVGRVTSVTLPTEIEDMESYDPVSEETKAELASKTLVFPRRLTVEELRSRLITRLKEDYSVGYVDVDLTEKGTVEYLAVGSRAAGIGPTIAPGTVAVAIRADPPNNASSGDQLQVWTTGEAPERLTSGELRGVAGDTVTLAVDEADAAILSPTAQYRLLTLPAEPQADREFATLLRSVDETMGTVTVAAGSELVGETADTISTAILAIRSATGTVLALPDRNRAFEADETLYILGRPDVLRRLEQRAVPPAESPATDDAVEDSETDGKKVAATTDTSDLDDSE
jgi:hypothetical protein